MEMATVGRAQVRTVNSGRGPTADVPVGSTPLHCAAFRGDLSIVQALLQARLAPAPPTPHLCRHTTRHKCGTSESHFPTLCGAQAELNLAERIDTASCSLPLGAVRRQPACLAAG